MVPLCHPGPWWCIKVMLHHPLLTAGYFRGHGKTVRQGVQIRGQALDPISVWIYTLFFSSRNLINQVNPILAFQYLVLVPGMYQIRGQASDLNIFVPRRNDKLVNWPVHYIEHEH